jgi:2-oxoisovalerate dehydrogenase E1 component
MAKAAGNDGAGTARTTGDLAGRLTAFVTERFPFATPRIVETLGPPLASAPRTASEIESLRQPVRELLERAFAEGPPDRLPETTPRVSATERHRLAAAELVDSVDGFIAREAIAASLTADERRELLRGMLLTRATDNQLKAFFLGGQIRHQGVSFQGKGFRSLGQEAIYGVALRLRRGARYRDDDGAWRGDVVAPVIRDAGVVLAMGPEAETVRMILSAQMGKDGPPMNGRDLHVGDLSWGVLPAAAPLAISSATVAGFARAFRLRGERRIAVSFIGEGGSSQGEWHEAINACAAHRLPAIFCVQNNQTALSTPIGDQSAVRVFADKAVGYGIPGITLDGTDPEAIAAAFAWAADRAREGLGPTLIELVAMRMCGHAHHDDMLYLGKDTHPTWDYPELTGKGYAKAETYAYWAERDPIVLYAARLLRSGVIGPGDLDAYKREAEERVATEAQAVIDAPWPSPVETHVEPLRDRKRSTGTVPLPAVEAAPEFSPTGATYLEAVMRGIGDAFEGDSRVFLYGEDVGGDYGNVFLLLRPLLERFGDRIINSPLSESGILGVCVGAALAGLRPIAEIQFNDFVATGFNQLVNNAAKIRYRWGGSVPMVVRLPCGGLRRAGPYHSQNTEAWFYRTPGLKIVAPSTPHDARALMASAVADDDPVLYYEHIALYRDPGIKQVLDDEPPQPTPLGRAALRRAGKDLAIISYGAYVHVCMEVAERLATDGIEASVLDLRSLAPLDRETIETVARHCGKVLVAHEDSRSGGIGESVAAQIQELAFEDLDAPVRIVGSLDTPVPYSPPLEDAFLPGADRVEQAARLLAAY